MNAVTPLNRQHVELARYQAMVDALLLALPDMAAGNFYEKYTGLDAVRAINEFLSGQPAQDMIDVIAGNLPETTTEEDSDPYFGACHFPEMRALMIREHRRSLTDEGSVL